MLIGRYTGLEFRLGDEIEVILQAAEPISGGLIFAAAVSAPAATAGQRRGHPGGRPGNRAGKGLKKAKIVRRKKKGRP